jgi:hypothetical protein
VSVAVAVGVDQHLHPNRVPRLGIVRQPDGGLLCAFAPWIAQRDHAERRGLIDRERLNLRAVWHFDGVVRSGEHPQAELVADRGRAGDGRSVGRDGLEEPASVARLGEGQ